jgi:hypothetical protein
MHKYEIERKCRSMSAGTNAPLGKTKSLGMEELASQDWTCACDTMKSYMAQDGRRTASKWLSQDITNYA